MLSILKNPAYSGKTYAFTTEKGKVRQRPKKDWIEIPDATPPIITNELFEAAQSQLRVNRELASRNNTVHQYLLRGHLRCVQCGHAFTGGTDIKKRKHDIYHRRLYRCIGKKREYTPFHKCQNKGWGADKLESLVWAEIGKYLSNRDLIAREIDKQSNKAEQAGTLEIEFKHIERQLKALDKEQHQLLQWALKGFPEHQVEAENQRLNKARETLKVQKAEFGKRLQASREAVTSIPKLKHFIGQIQTQLSDLDFEGKRLALEMLGVTVWLDGESVEITGTIDPEMSCIATTPPP